MPTLFICWQEANAKNNNVTTLTTAALSLDKSPFHLPATSGTFGTFICGILAPSSGAGIAVLFANIPANDGVASSPSRWMCPSDLYVDLGVRLSSKTEVTKCHRI